MRLVLATFNAGKRRELERLLDLPGLVLESLADHPGSRPPRETGGTLEENARLKARAALAHIGLPVIADDTGLEVDALGGGPGVRSARFAGEQATDADNVARLLDALAGVEPERRSARFRTVCMACFPDGREIVGVGALEGRIAETPRGEHGFGYDPVFEVAGLGRTLAELSVEEKNRLSHRALAARELRRRLVDGPG
jgi:XTP/dITP diphosphohydrolase